VTLTSRLQGDWQVITVTDTGPGFGGQDTARLLERFQRGQGAQTIIGSGLGLTIAAAAAAAHGGRIDLRDGPQGGACVSLILPRG
jgi:signal transduction histidine kinase